ncbi:hypothetical protein D3C81_1872600 [compost metagenome]
MRGPVSKPFAQCPVIKKDGALGRAMKRRSAHILHQLGHFLRFAGTRQGDGDAL